MNTESGDFRGARHYQVVTRCENGGRLSRRAMSAHARASSNAMVSVVIDWPGQHEGMAELEKCNSAKAALK